MEKKDRPGRKRSNWAVKLHVEEEPRRKLPKKQDGHAVIPKETTEQVAREPVAEESKVV